MAQYWYPVIDILECLECGACVQKCTHGVYDKERAPIPVVINPDGCIDHCHGCGNLCPKGAISYVGEDTDWIPFALHAKGIKPFQAGGCSCCKEEKWQSRS